MSLLDILDKSCVKANLESLDKTGAVRELADLLHRNRKVAERELVVKDVLNRESKGSTGIGKGVAVPHAKTGAVGKLTLAIGISREGVDFDSIDQKPAHIIFLLLAPPHSSGPHVEALSEIARLITPPGIKEKLKKAATADEIAAVITDYYNS